ncbi:MAG: hypothetical protein ACUZ8N_03470 [Candidatus Scalindua sp.]
MKRKTPKRPYKSRPPFINLQYALDIIEQVYLKCAGSATRDSFSSIINNVLSSSSFANKFNACRNFGLLKAEGNKISLTDLASKIVAPHNEEERAVARKEAFLKINVFQEVYERYCGKILDPAYLPNFFEREVKVGSVLKDMWAKSFIESGQAAGLLKAREDEKYVVLEGATILPPEENKGAKGDTGKTNGDELPPPPPPPPNDEDGYYRAKVTLTDNKFAEFSIPDNLSVNDARKLQNHLDGLKIIIKGYTKEEIKEETEE